MDPRLVVWKFNETIGLDYTLVLNKFNVVPDHVSPRAFIAFTVSFVTYST